MKLRKLQVLFGAAALCLGLAFSMNTAAATDTASAEANGEDIPFVRGTVESNVYTNDSVGLRIDLSSANWTIANDEQLQQLGGMTKEMLEDTDVNDLIEKGSALMDFYAQDNETGSTLNMNIQKADLGSLAAFYLMPDDEFIQKTHEEFIKEGYDQQIFSALNVTDGVMETGTVKFLGKDTPCLRIHGTITTQDGVEAPIYECMVYYRKHGFLSTITAASFGDDYTDDCFSYISEN